MAIMNVLSQMISLFMMMFVGFLAAKVGLIEPDFRRKLSSLVLNTACPCIIVSSVLKSGSAPSAMVATLGVSVVFYAVMIVLAFLLVHIIPTPPAERRLDQLMLVCTNLIFMGIPIIQSFYGAEGVSLLSMFILLFNFLVFTYGVMMVGGSDIKLKQLCNPGVFSALLALFFGVTGLRLPAPVENTLSTIGAVNTPLAMMIIGASLAHSDIRAAVSNPRLYRVSLLRLILIPVIIMGIVAVLPINRMLAGICVIGFRHAHCQQLRHALRRLYAAGYDRFSRHYRLNSGECCHPAGHCRVDGRDWAGVKNTANCAFTPDTPSLPEPDTARARAPACP